MNEPLTNTASPSSATRYWLVVGVLVLLIVGVIFSWVRNSRQDQALLRNSGSELQANAALLAYASKRALPIYKENCASCHGANLQGDRSKGILNLGDSVWLYGSGQITDIEQTILYGIRSGHPKSHNLAEMPGFGRIGQLTQQEVKDVVEYVLMISKQPHDETALERGKFVFQNHGLCYDCHATDGYGVSDYGTPLLPAAAALGYMAAIARRCINPFLTVARGRCPAWVNKLSFAEIRILAAFLYSRSHSEQAGAPVATPTTTQSSNKTGT